MEKLKLLRWATMPLGSILQIVGILDLAEGAIGWGWSGWIWLSLGLVAFYTGALWTILKLWRENKELKLELTEQQSQVREQLKHDLQLMELRKIVRGNSAADIPPTLHSIYSHSKTLTQQQMESTTAPEETLKMIIADLLYLQLSEVEQLLDQHKNLDRQQIAKAASKVQKLMGIKKKTDRLDPKWQLRIGKVMDDHQIGLGHFEGDSEYEELTERLETQRITLSGTKLNLRIDSYMADVYTLNSLRLFIAYSQPHNYKRLLPQEMRDWLDLMDHTIERRMRINLAQVNNTLERYQIGEVDE